MNQAQTGDAIRRRGFLKAACATPALGLVLRATPGQAAVELPGEAGEEHKMRRPDELKAEFDEYGFVVLRELIPRAEALHSAQRIREIMSRRPDADKSDQHISGFWNHLEPQDDPAFLPLVTQPDCLDLARRLLGPGFQMTEVGCRFRKPGAPAGPMHVTRPLDSIAGSGLPMPNVCFVLAFSWMLNDLTRDMGATFYLPFSHHAPRGPRTGVSYRYLVGVEAPAGSVLIHHGALWHHFGANTTPDKTRVGFMGGYFPHWMDPIAAGWQPMKRSVRDRLPPAVQRMNTHVIDG